MHSKKSRAKILSNIQKPLNAFEILDLNIPGEEIFPNIGDSYQYFKESFTKIDGKLIECRDLSDALKLLKAEINERDIRNVFSLEEEFKEDLEDHCEFDKNKISDYSSIQATIIKCEALIARTGSILVSSQSKTGRRLNIIPDLSIVIAYQDQLFNEIEEALAFLNSKYKDHRPSMVSMISGPSRTADIEKTLVLGAHGPKEILLFLINN